MSLIAEYNKGVFAFSTFFYSKLVTSGFDGVSKWMKQVDIFDKELLLILIHLGTHWCLPIVDFSLEEFCYYDSMKAVAK